MKKVLLVLAVVVIALSTVFGAIACSNVNQINFISVVARDYEQYTYIVYEVVSTTEKNAIGTFTYSFKRIVVPDGNVTKYVLNDKEYTFSSGGVIKTQLNVTEGTYKGENVTSEVLFQNAFSPIASKKVYNAFSDGAADEARSYVSVIDYTAKKNISITVNGKEQTFKKPNYCYDNDTLYSLARGSDISRQSYSLSVAGVDNQQGGTRTIAMVKMVNPVSMDVPFMSAEPLSATCVAITAAAKYGSGTSGYVYFVPSYRHTDSTGKQIDLNKVPVRIDEGKYMYVLTAISTEE